MGLRFTVLASGSAGNATLVRAGGFGLLLDAGLGPRVLAQRLANAGAAWADVHAVLVSHTHSDHWNDDTLAHLFRRQVPIYCHPGHHQTLGQYCRAYPSLRDAGLLRPYVAGEDLALAPHLRCRPLPVRHDSGETFGFRLEGTPDLFGEAHSVGYVSDLGCWDDELAEALAGVDLLAVEFNHDVRLQRSSGRSPRLIARVLGDEGHLSNEQAAGLLREVLRRSPPGQPRHVVQLHLSRDCNRPALAAEAAHSVLAALKHAAEVHTACQDRVGKTLDLDTPASRRRPSRAARRPPARADSWLPGLENE